MPLQDQISVKTREENMVTTLKFVVELLFVPHGTPGYRGTQFGKRRF